jgi:hypothetical protein
MMRGEQRVLPLSDNYKNALLALHTGILPERGALEDQGADFVHILRVLRNEASKMAKEIGDA